MTLSNGTQIDEYAADNGSTVAVVVGEDRCMTDAEWNEYVDYVRALRVEQNRARLAARKIANREAWERDRRLMGCGHVGGTPNA